LGTFEARHPPAMRISVLLAALLLACLPPWAAAQSAGVLDSLNSDLNIESLDTRYDSTSGLFLAKGDVAIAYGDAEIRCGQASFNAKTGEIIARDQVVVWKAGVTYKGDNIVYNTNSGEVSGDAVRSSLPMEIGHVFYQTDHFQGDAQSMKQIDADGGIVTTHDSSDPNFKMRARRITVYPQDRIVLHGVTLYLGDQPFFWLPRITQSLNQEVGYRFNVGQQSRWGAFMLNQYNVRHGDHTLARYHLDLRSSRGIGAGADLLSQRHQDNWRNLTGLKLYYQNDSKSDLNRTNSVRMPTGENRYRIDLQHRIYLSGPAQSIWYADFDVHRLSDPHFYEDFFFNDFRQTPEPENQVSLVNRQPGYLMTLMTRFQANQFYTVGEKLPELAIDWTRRPLGESGLFHQGNFSVGYLREAVGTTADAALRAAFNTGKASASDLDALRRLTGIGSDQDLDSDGANSAINSMLNRYAMGSVEYARAHTYHELLFPKTLGGWLSVVPRLGLGFTHYQGIRRTVTGDNAERLDSYNDQDSEMGGDFTRPIVHAGLDVSFKLSRNWSDISNDRLGLNGLRHILQPYVNASYLDAKGPTTFAGVDRLTPTTRPRPIDLPLYSGIDGLRSWSTARIGVKNFLQTRRDYTSTNNGYFYSATDRESQSYTLASMNTYLDVFNRDPGGFIPTDDKGGNVIGAWKNFDRSASSLYNELTLSPTPWFNLWMDAQLPVISDVGNFTELNQGIGLMPTASLSLNLGHQFISDNPAFQDSDLFFSRIFARLNDNWGFAMNHVYEGNDGTMEFQSYSITRDLSSWVVSVGGMMRNNRGGQTDSGLMLTFTLKDFPNFTIPFDIDPNPSGRGGSQSSGAANSN
jgi:hypothetical protein